VLLLRPALDALRAAGHDVLLLAPSRTASVLVRGGALDAAELLDADAPAWAFAATGAAPSSEARERLGPLDAAIAFTTRIETARALERVAPIVVTRAPWPEPGQRFAAAASVEAVDRWARPVAPRPLRPHPEDLAAVAPLRERLEEGFVALHPGSGSARKNWPHFPALAQRLDRPALVVVGPAEEERGFEPADWPAGAAFARRLSPGQLGALLADAGLVIANDGGVAHLAAAFGAPVLALYGPTDPGTWAPWGERVTALRAPGAALAELAVDDVLAYVEGARTSVRLISR
jgi:hypothetical protein